MDTALFSPSSLFNDSDKEDENSCNTEQRTHAFPGMVCSLNCYKLKSRNPYTPKSGRPLSVFITQVSLLLFFSPFNWMGSWGLIIFYLYMMLMQELVIREFSFHELNANLLWPGTFAFAEWLVQNKSLFQGRRILELGRSFSPLKTLSFMESCKILLLLWLLLWVKAVCPKREKKKGFLGYYCLRRVLGIWGLFLVECKYKLLLKK